MKIGENNYKVILLDTNIIREIVLNNNGCVYGFLKNFLSSEIKYVPCFSIYNVIELKPYKDIYEKFLDFFSIIPCLMLFPYKNILEAEFLASLNNKPITINNQIANAFIPVGDCSSYNIKDFLSKLWSDEELISQLEYEIHELKNTAECWNNQRVELHENLINEKYYRTVEKETIIKNLVSQGISIKDGIDITRFPGTRIMEYSQFSRVHNSKKNIKANDVMDIKISCAIPYVDAVITENYQADIYKKAKKFIKGLEKLEIYRLIDVRS